MQDTRPSEGFGKKLFGALETGIALAKEIHKDAQEKESQRRLLEAQINSQSGKFYSTGSFVNVFDRIVTQFRTNPIGRNISISLNADLYHLTIRMDFNWVEAGYSVHMPDLSQRMILTLNLLPQADGATIIEYRWVDDNLRGINNGYVLRTANLWIKNIAESTTF